VLFITAGAWIALLVKPGGTALADDCCLSASVPTTISSASLDMLLLSNPPGALALGWLLMLVAMMAPMLAAPIRHILNRSLARRRARAVLLFISSYVAIWMAAGAVLLSLALAVRLFAPESFVPFVVVAVVTFLWECSPAKQRCLNRGHAHTELAAFGRAADLDVLRFGVTHAAWCVGSCWALMLLPEMFTRGHLVIMAAVTLWLFAERLERPIQPRWRLRGIGTCKAARMAVTHLRTLLHPWY
jgi:predicted metal-binding membrane protein